ncbi:phosphatidylinositol-4-phosphate 5-kinase, putative [Bodo saltans]|uniref:Phosphatidylinositol-4-phosphate 5-kinase, putative n=1 Tax=Bodo saltans TaxID=75058 RepID=A0A0S4JRR3_BODSA|nr:phosphatidylinositol-4-phosphate 5-kinase, putative [Bodo saltans]|eukprot:CUG91213.1 phosphatidylinositol-4-phosphate 5-kinase, putative [Bodo saltans]
MGVFQSVGGAATSGRGFTGHQVAEALKVAAQGQSERHQERVRADGGGNAGAHGHRRTRSTVVQSLGDLTDESFTDTAEYRSVLKGDGNESVELVVTEYAPEVFRYLRQLEGVLETQFSKEWDIPEERLKLELGEGRSMAMFLKSRSMEFMCKTISDVEVNVLLGILKHYATHLSSNRHSLLMRFLMLLKVQVKDEIGYILCFADIFAGCNLLNERWDIKGRRPKPGKYRQFPAWAEEQSRRNTSINDPAPTHNRRASYDPTALQQQGSVGPIPHLGGDKLLTRKDKDLTRLFWLEEEHREELLDQLTQDFQFLRGCGLMDYSVLIGVRYDQGSGPSANVPARSMRMTYALGEEGQRDIKEIRSICREGSPEISFRFDPNVITHNSKYHYGVTSMQGHETYYIGIIDMLTTYNWKKKTANFCKTFLWTPATLSTIPPKAYEQRIDKYSHRIFASAESAAKADEHD